MCKLYTHVFLHHALSRRYDPIPAQKAMNCKTLLPTFAPNTKCISDHTHNSVTVVTPTVHHPHQCRRITPDTLLQRCISVPPYGSQAKTMYAQMIMLCLIKCLQHSTITLRRCQRTAFVRSSASIYALLCNFNSYMCTLIISSYWQKQPCDVSCKLIML